VTSARAAGCVGGALLALFVAVPPVARFLEGRMSTHMLVQMPLLLLAGALLAAPLPRVLCMDRWNLAGVPALLAVSLVLAFWMTPIALDHAVADAGWDAAKASSLVLAGGFAAASWRTAPLVVQAFFGGNAVWMGIAVGLLYQAPGQRLCNAYLEDDQVDTGVLLTWVAILAATLWAVRLAIRLHRDPSGDSEV